jgi:hypothetical protein
MYRPNSPSPGGTPSRCSFHGEEERNEQAISSKMESEEHAWVPAEYGWVSVHK